jgi:hypothetical protein
MVTAEYVVGTLAAVSVAGVLVAVGADDWFFDLLWDLLRSALRPSVLLDQLKYLPWPGGL